jgi:hypothetical protein
MPWFKCPNCGRRGEESDARQGYERGDRDQPGYPIDACRICAPSEEDIEQARDAHWDRRIDEAREA